MNKKYCNFKSQTQMEKAENPLSKSRQQIFINMKKYFLALLTLTTLGVSCNKSKTTLEPSTINSNSNNGMVSQVYQQGDIEIEYDIYHNGEQVSNEDGINLESESLFTIVTDRLSSDNKLGVYYFDNETLALDFLQGKDDVIDILENIQWSADLREYAINSGAIDYYEANGSISNEYQEYLDTHPKPHQNKKSRGLGFLHDYLNMGGASILIGTSPLPVLGGFNNRAESGSQVGLGAVIHDRTFFRSPSYYISIGFGPLTYINFNGGLINFMNRTSSTS